MMEDNLMDECFVDFDLVTKEEYMILFDKVFNKLKYCRLACNLISSGINPDSANFSMPYVFFMMVKDSLKEIVCDKNPKKKIYEAASHLFKYMKEEGMGDEISKEASPVGKAALNMMLSLIAYIILY